MVWLVSDRIELHK